MMDVQAEWVAAIARGDVELPDRSEMVADIERENRRIARRYPDSPRYGLELDPPVYVLDIEEELQPHQRWLRLRRAARYFLRDIANALHYRGRRESSEDRRLLTKLAALGLVVTGVTVVVGLLRAVRWQRAQVDSPAYLQVLDLLVDRAYGLCLAEIRQALGLPVGNTATCCRR